MKQILLAACFAMGLMAGSAQAQTDSYSIMAPASPGGGWDQTARAMQQALQSSGIAKDVEVYNVPGAGGTIGIAQFASQHKGDPSQLMVGGYVMVGAILTNKSPVTLEDVTPIARLIGEYEVIVVPENSPYKTLEDLLADLKKDPGAVSWAGGSAGGVDHIAVGLIAEAAGVDPTKINYIAYSGGGEALAAILGGQVSAGISGYGEFQGQIEAGKLRVLAVSSEKPLEGIDAKTLTDQGVDVVVQNWRMVAAPSGISDEEKQQIVADMEAMVKTDEWQKILENNNWEDTFLAGEAFQQELKKDIEQTRKVLTNIGLVKE